MPPDDLHDWYRPEDDFGPIAGARRCRKCDARFFMMHVDRPPPVRGCPAKAGEFLNRDEIDAA